MIAAAIALAVTSLVAGTPPPPQLLVIDRPREQPSDCQAPPAGWDHNLAMDEAAPEAVGADFERYFGGLSVQVTTVLEAAWKGSVWLCTATDERLGPAPPGRSGGPPR